MRNYAEELAFWYLRLNGFFPITDFVLHRPQPQRSSDCDLLGVRLPHVFEPVGGNPNDWDDQVAQWLEGDRTLGVICEVKAGAYVRQRILSKQTVSEALARLGFVPFDDVRTVAEQLETEAMVNIGNSYRVVKLLITNDAPRRRHSFFVVSVQSVRDFIARRMRYYPLKATDWTMFPSTLIQEIIWEEHRRLG